MTTQAQSSTASTPESRTPYPRRWGGRIIRFFFRILWLIVLLAAIAAVTPNAIALVNRYGIAGLGDPAHLSELITFSQLAPLDAQFSQASLFLGIAAGVIFLLSILAAILAGRDARRERRSVRDARATTEQPALTMSALETRTSAMEYPTTAPAAEAPAAALPQALARAIPGDEPPLTEEPDWPQPESARPAVASSATSAEPEDARPTTPVPPRPAEAPDGWAAVPAQAAPWYASVTSPPPPPATLAQESTPAPDRASGPFSAPQEAPMSGPSSQNPYGPDNRPAQSAPSAPPTSPTPWQLMPQPPVPADAPPATPSPVSTPLTEAWQRTRAYVSQLSQPLVTENVAVSPAPFAARTPGWTQDRTVLDRKLGRWVDGWADTVVGMAEHAPLLIQAFVTDMPSHLNARTWAVSTRLGVTGLSSVAEGIELTPLPQGVARIASAIGPAIKVVPRALLRIVGIDIIGRQRDYLFTAMSPGAAVGINISATGQDLYIAWDLFIRRVWNEVALGLVALVGILVGLFAGINGVQAEKRLFFAEPTTGMLIGAFIGPFLLAGLLAAAIFVFVASVLGRKSFLLKEIDFFEAHDVQAMMLSVHKSLLAAAQDAGINVSLLRAKGSYRVGSGGRVI